MLIHSNNNHNENQIDPKIIRDQLSEWKKYIKAEEEILEVTNILLKHKIISFDDVEQLKHDQDRNFLNENKYITHSILCDTFRQFGDNPEGYINILSRTHKSILKDIRDKGDSYYDNIIDPSNEELGLFKRQYLSFRLASHGNISKNDATSVASIIESKKLIVEKELLSGLVGLSKWEKQNFNCYFAEQENKENYRNNVIKQYEVNINILKDNIYKTYELIKLLEQQLQTPRLYLVVPTPNHYPKAINKKQKGILKELDKKDQEAKALLKQKILGDTDLTQEQKNDYIEKINAPSTNPLFELDRYLGNKLEPKVNLVLRAIRAIVFDAVQSKKVESHHHPIKFSTNRLYELCGVCLITDNKKNKKWYHPEQTKSIINIITRSSLTEKILVKNEFDKIIKSTSFILEATFHSNKVEIKKNRKKELLSESITQEQITHITIKISDFLFANHINQLENSYLQDIEGYIRFKKLNKTTIGNQLFLWLEIYLSRIDKLKEINFKTLIKELILEERYKHSPKEVKNNIERTLNDMIKANTLIKDYKLVIGAVGQEKYVFTNARYIEKPKLEMIKADNKKSTKSKNKRNKK